MPAHSRSTHISTVMDHPIWRWLLQYCEQDAVVQPGWRVVGQATVPVSLLRARIHTPTGLRLRPIEKTPHFPFIQSLVVHRVDRRCEQQYFEYLASYFQERYVQQRARIVRKLVSELVRTYQSHPHHGSIVLRCPRDGKDPPLQLTISDGIHRACVAQALGFQSVCGYLSPMKNHRELEHSASVRDSLQAAPRVRP